MVGVLIIAHAPLASALKAVARHTFPEAACAMEALDVPPEAPLEESETIGRKLLLQMPAREVLIFTDVFGASPCNLAQRLAASCETKVVKVVAGVNVPMVWRSLCYANEGLDRVVERAVAGATQGVIQVSFPRPQNQTSKSASNDQNHDHHQQ
jgi:PTS system ascorbate-specific IIA component